MKQQFPAPLQDDRRPPVEDPWVKPLTHANTVNRLGMIRSSFETNVFIYFALGPAYCNANSSKEYKSDH